MSNNPDYFTSEVGGTFHGLERMVTKKGDMLTHLQQALLTLTRNKFERSFADKHGQGQAFSRQAYKYAAFADTFFSDVLTADLVHSILEAGKANRVPCRFLFLNPFCDHAKTRALMLTADEAMRGKQQEGLEPSMLGKIAIEAAEKWSQIDQNSRDRSRFLDQVVDISLDRARAGLSQLGLAAHALIQDQPLTPAAAEPLSGRDLIVDMRRRLASVSNAQVRFLENGFEFEIRFTSEMLQVPTYILGDYCYRGHMAPRSSASRKPWSIYRDDPHRIDDMWSVSLDAFEQGWKYGISIKSLLDNLDELERAEESKNTIMVAYSEDNKFAMEQVLSTVQEASKSRARKYSAKGFALAQMPADNQWETLDRLLNSASAGIALLLPDERIFQYQRRRDKKPTSKIITRTRPNVIHELGLMQSRYGKRRVLIVKQADVHNYESPTNFQDLHAELIAIAQGGMPRFDEKQLAGVIARFLDSLES